MNSTDATTAARKQALRWLRSAEQSAASMHVRLLEAGHDPHVAKSLLEALLNEGLVNDARCAESLVHGWTRNGPLAPRELRRRLVARGIPDEVAENTIRAACTENEFALALSAAKRKQPSLARLAPDVASRRLHGYLARRGFEQDTAFQVLEQLGLVRADD